MKKADILCTDLAAVWAEVWVVCAGQDKTPGVIWAGAHGTAGLSWDTDQEDSMTPVSEDKQQQQNLFKEYQVHTDETKTFMRNTKQY